MRKILALVLAIVMVFSMTIMASAEQTTILTTNVPNAEYTLNIPADQKIEYNVIETNIGKVTVTDGKGFAIGKNVEVTINYTDFTSDTTSTKIPFVLAMSNSSANDSSWTKNIASGESIIFKGRSDGTVAQYSTQRFETNTSTSGYTNKDMDETLIFINSSDWGKALGGSYTATITFTAQVVVEE